MSGTREGAAKGLAKRIAEGTAGTIGLAEMRARSAPGECIACGGPAIPRSSNPAHKRKRKRGDWQDTCGGPDCKAAWFRYWRRDQRRMITGVAESAAALAKIEARS